MAIDAAAARPALPRVRARAARAAQRRARARRENPSRAEHARGVGEEAHEEEDAHALPHLAGEERSSAMNARGVLGPTRV